MALRLEELAKTIDLTLLDPDADSDDVERVCAAAAEHHFAAVSVLPDAVVAAAARLRGADVKVCAVVGFPFGADEPRAKVATAKRAVGDGAGELEVVVNVRAMLSNDFRLVRDELVAVERAVRLKTVNLGRGVVQMKAVLETGQLDDKRQRLACMIVEAAGFDFAVTSTGYDSGMADVRDVELLRECLPEGVGVKASGGLETVHDVQEMLAAGAGRIGLTDAAVVTQKTVREPV